MLVAMVPTVDDVRAYQRGALSPAAAAVVDAWLAAADPAEVEAILAEMEAPALVPAACVEPAAAGFHSEAGTRFAHLGQLGEGVMGRVQEVRDQALDRVVAIKVLRPRGREESLASFRLRDEAFRREAAVTARLDHPAIPAVHDVGSCDGLPAFTLRRLTSRALSDVAPLPLVEGLEILRRAAEAIAHAHERGIVHRDVSPTNVRRGEHGVVDVIDWGFATDVGTVAAVRVGTPGFTAPEQAAGAPAAPTADVYALGALGCYVLLGVPPAQATWSDLPPAVTALLRRCLADDPAARYADAGAVVEDITRWFTEGLTTAQALGPWSRVVLRLRRSPRVRLGALVAMILGLAGASVAGWQAHRAERDIQAALGRWEATPLEDAGAVALALDEVRAVAPRGGDRAAHIEARLAAAQEVAQVRAATAHMHASLQALLARTRMRGPAADLAPAWRAALQQAGLHAEAAQVQADAALVRQHPLRHEVLTALAFWWRAEAAAGAPTAFIAEVIDAAAPTPAWAALGRVLRRTTFGVHDPRWVGDDDTEIVVHEAETAEVAIALFGPEARLSAAARTILATHPGEFWCLLAAGRAAWAAGDAETAQRCAWIAHGVEPASALPHRLAAYAAFARHDDPTLALAAERALAVAPDDWEIAALTAVARARAGDLAGARAVWGRIPAEHLHHHLHHPEGHPMEAVMQAAVALGLALP